MSLISKRLKAQRSLNLCIIILTLINHMFFSNFVDAASSTFFVDLHSNSHLDKVKQK